MRIAPALVGAALTFWYAPLRTIDGEMLIVMLPDPSAVAAAVAVYCRRTPVESRFCGLMPLAPAASMMSPAATAPVVAVHPLVTRVAPDCPAPLTSGVPPRTPTVCDRMF